jgi:hypothetical protein
MVARANKTNNTPAGLRVPCTDRVPIA